MAILFSPKNFSPEVSRIMFQAKISSTLSGSQYPQCSKHQSYFHHRHHHSPRNCFGICSFPSSFASYRASCVRISRGPSQVAAAHDDVVNEDEEGDAILQNHDDVDKSSSDSLQVPTRNRVNCSTSSSSSFRGIGESLAVGHIETAASIPSYKKGLATIKAYLEKGKWESALELFKGMDLKRLTEDPQYATLAHQAITLRISTLGYGGKWWRAIDVLKAYHNTGLRVSVHGFTAALSALQQSFQWEKTLRLFKQMATLSVRRDAQSYRIALQARRLQGNKMAVLRLLEEMREIGGEYFSVDELLLAARTRAHISQKTPDSAMPLSPFSSAATIIPIRNRSTDRGGGSYTITRAKTSKQHSSSQGGGRGRRESGMRPRLRRTIRGKTATTATEGRAESSTTQKNENQSGEEEKELLWNSLREEVENDEEIEKEEQSSIDLMATNMAGRKRVAKELWKRILDRTKDIPWKRVLTLWQQMKRLEIAPDSIVYHHVIATLTSRGRWKDAVEAFEEMKKQNLKPLTETLPSVVSSLSWLGESDAAMEVLDQYQGFMGWKRSPGRAVLEKIEKRVLADITKKAEKYMDKNESELLFTLSNENESKEQGLILSSSSSSSSSSSPTSHSLFRRRHGGGDKTEDFDSELHDWRLVMRAGRSWEKSLLILRSLGGGIASPETLTPSAAKESERGGAITSSSSFSSSTSSSPPLPPLAAYAVAVRECARASQWRAAMCLLSEVTTSCGIFPSSTNKITRNENEHNRHNRDLFNDLSVLYVEAINGFADCRHIKGAMMVFAAASKISQKERRDEGFSVEPQVFNSLLRACERSRQWAASLTVLARMVELNTKMDAQTFTHVIRALSRGRQWRRALDLFADVPTTHGLRREQQMFGAAMEACYQGNKQTKEWLRRQMMESELQNREENNDDDDEVDGNV